MKDRERAASRGGSSTVAPSPSGPRGASAGGAASARTTRSRKKAASPGAAPAARGRLCRRCRKKPAPLDAYCSTECCKADYGVEIASARKPGGSSGDDRYIDK